MARKVKYGKITIVIFLTVLIWVWADLALDETLTGRPGVVVVYQSTNPKLWVSFNQTSSADIKITLVGPHSAIAEERRKLKEGVKLEFDFDAAQEKMDKPGNYSLGLLPFLQKDKKIRQLGLTVKSCEPEVLDVQVVELVEKPLTVRCFNENAMPLEAKSIEPSRVNMFVPSFWEGEKLRAEVKLTPREIDQARLMPIEKKPFIELAPGQIREADTVVKITVPPVEDVLKEYTITTPKLGIILSLNLQGRYKVNVTNLSEVLGPIAIRATAEAKQAYEQQPFQMILYVLDDDKNVATEQRKTVVYNLPESFVRKGEITRNQGPVTVRFMLVPLPAEPATP